MNRQEKWDPLVEVRRDVEEVGALDGNDIGREGEVAFGETEAIASVPGACEAVCI
jgi:hypothetical protein